MAMSERREKRRVECGAGTGTLSRAGVTLGTVSYLMEIWKTVHIVQGFGPGPAQEIDGLREIRIRLVTRPKDTFRFSMDHDTLTLRLEDGRQLDGFLNGDAFIASSQLTAA
jgi:hypothetical protein